MKRLKKLLVSTLIVLSILATPSISSLAATNTTPNTSQQQLLASEILPQGVLFGDLTIGQEEIVWDGSYNEYQVSIREWASLKSFQDKPENGGSTFSKRVFTNSYKYQFKKGRVYRVWVYGKDAGKLYSIGGYEWEQE